MAFAFGGQPTSTVQGLPREIRRSQASVEQMARYMERLAEQGDEQQIVPTAGTERIRVLARALRSVASTVEEFEGIYQQDQAEDERRSKDPTKGPAQQRRADVTAARNDV